MYCIFTLTMYNHLRHPYQNIMHGNECILSNLYINYSKCSKRLILRKGIIYFYNHTWRTIWGLSFYWISRYLLDALPIRYGNDLKCVFYQRHLFHQYCVWTTYHICHLAKTFLGLFSKYTKRWHYIRRILINSQNRQQRTIHPILQVHLVLHVCVQNNNDWRSIFSGCYVPFLNRSNRNVWDFKINIIITYTIIHVMIWVF